MIHHHASIPVYTSEPRGFTLLIAVILTTVLVTVGLALFDIAYKQIVLTSAVRHSQYAFYAADTGMECALYWDQKFNAFSPSSPRGTITCGGSNISVSSTMASNIRTSTFSTPCLSGRMASVTVMKANAGYSCNAQGSRSCLYTNGFSSCSSSDARRVERGLHAFY